MIQVNDALSLYQTRIEGVLDRVLPSSDTLPQRLHQAMRYAVLEGGKRARPMLVYATGEALGIPVSVLDTPAAAVELIHAYSLVHDDLPAMDDDDLRRGKPTCHRQYDEATAILVGDALQALAFRLLATAPELDVSPAQRLRMIQQLGDASGSQGMVGGQAIDLAAEGLRLSEAELETMHTHKTGALIRSSVLLAAYCSENVSEQQLAKLDYYAKCLGLAFQVQDDILDVTSDTATMGKQQGADVAAGKATYPSIIGMSAAQEKLRYLHAEAVNSLAGIQADLLRDIAEFTVKRLH
ncbi:MAG: (2E,6E)-farnesyl diphosphate synthase [Thiolinea sp.]